EQEPILVDVPDVARVHESLAVDGRRRRFLVAVVPRKNGVRPDQDLAVAGDPDLDAGQRLPDAAELEVVPAVDGRRGRNLGEPVALEDEDVDRMEELGDVARQ